jgi:hypothetical protein
MRTSLQVAIRAGFLAAWAGQGADWRAFRGARVILYGKEEVDGHSQMTNCFALLQRCKLVVLVTVCYIRENVHVAPVRWRNNT